jgi:hypothetical protein
VASDAPPRGPNYSPPEAKSRGGGELFAEQGRKWLGRLGFGPKTWWRKIQAVRHKSRSISARKGSAWHEPIEVLYLEGIAIRAKNRTKIRPSHAGLSKIF